MVAVVVNGYQIVSLRTLNKEMSVIVSLDSMLLIVIPKTLTATDVLRLVYVSALTP